jgi:IclR family transcriptional regulator, KDG regulon repressor
VFHDRVTAPPWRSSTAAFGRAIVLLERVCESAQPIGPSALARQTAIPKTTVFRLLRMLTAHDLVTGQPNGYVPGAAMRRLAGLIRPRMSYDLRNLLGSYLVELYERTGDMISLGELDGDDMVVIMLIYGRLHRRMPMPGERTPAHCSAIGKLLLAHQAGYAPGSLQACTPQTITSPERLTRQLAEIRGSGMALALEEHVVGLTDIAMPVIVAGEIVAGIARSRPYAMPADEWANATQRQITLAASAAVSRYLR